MQQSEIEKRANQVLAQHHVTESPFKSIKTICDNEGILLKKTNFSDEVDGTFAVIQGQKSIFFNPNKIEGRQHFTQAHELGHYFLNHTLDNGASFACKVGTFDERKSPTEYEADCFSAAFLMPRQMILHEYQRVADIFQFDTGRPLFINNQDWNIKMWAMVKNHLMPTFGVSEAALTVRLAVLGKVRKGK